MNKVTKKKTNLDDPLEGLSSSLLLLLFFFFMSITAPLTSWGKDAPFPSREKPTFQEPKSTLGEAIEEKSFLILKERLDRLSRQITKHKGPSSPEIPEYVEKKDPELPAFPEMTEKDSIEDSLLMLKKRLDNLHHVLNQES